VNNGRAREQINAGPSLRGDENRVSINAGPMRIDNAVSYRAEMIRSPEISVQPIPFSILLLSGFIVPLAI
jgi:hypothetical protein